MRKSNLKSQQKHCRSGSSQVILILDDGDFILDDGDSDCVGAL